MAERPNQLATRPAGSWSISGVETAFATTQTFTTMSSGGVAWSRPMPEMMFESPDDYAALLVDSRRRPHSVNNHPAIKYSDGREVYYWHGVEVPDFVIKNPETITLQHIGLASNSEVKRVLIEKYGTSRYLQESGAKRVSGDSFGELYRLKQKGDEDIVMVKVKNSTPEPDGSVKFYWLRVPPATRTPQEGVAWTFGMNSKEYKPEMET